MSGLVAGLVAGLAGGVLAGVVALGGVTTYNAATTSDTQQTSPSSVGYADE